MISVSRFSSQDPAFLARARSALELIAARPGFIRGSIGRATDDPELWVLVTEWQDVGSYRRGISGYDVKVGAWPLLAEATPEPSAFEVVVRADGAQIQG